jgi:translation initiation factor 3 subunit M
LDVWKNSLQNVLAVIRQQKLELAKEKEQEANTNASGERRGGYRPYNRAGGNQNDRREPSAIEVD